MTTTPRTGPLSGRKAQANRNDEVILRAAREVFVADPAAPISAVAKAAGVGISALYRRYEGKEVLLQTLCAEGLATYIACAEAALAVEGRSAHEIFGSPDDMKLRSCATLFASVSPEGSVFHQLLDKYYHGERDSKTLHLLGVSPEAK